MHARRFYHLRKQNCLRQKALAAKILLALWWHISKHFGFRGRDENRSLKWGDVKLTKDPETGNDSLVWTAYRGGKCENGSN